MKIKDQEGGGGHHMNEERERETERWVRIWIAFVDREKGFDSR